MFTQFRRCSLAVADTVLVFSMASPPAVAAPDPITINVGIQPGDSTAEGFYAQDVGFFKDAGLDVKLTFLLNGPALTCRHSPRVRSILLLPVWAS
jgi:ABC-type nitrate/sulfonate/bicarbonate transport system substrate-binding protein